MEPEGVYERIDGGEDSVIEPETWTKVPKFDLWLEGILDYSELSAQDKRRADRLMRDAPPSERGIET